MSAARIGSGAAVGRPVARSTKRWIVSPSTAREPSGSEDPVGEGAAAAPDRREPGRARGRVAVARRPAVPRREVAHDDVAPPRLPSARRGTRRPRSTPSAPPRTRRRRSRGRRLPARRSRRSGPSPRSRPSVRSPRSVDYPSVSSPSVLLRGPGWRLPATARPADTRSRSARSLRTVPASCRSSSPGSTASPPRADPSRIAAGFLDVRGGSRARGVGGALPAARDAARLVRRSSTPEAARLAGEAAARGTAAGTSPAGGLAASAGGHGSRGRGRGPSRPIREGIARGDVYQANLTRRTARRAPRSPRGASPTSSRDDNPVPYAICIETGDGWPSSRTRRSSSSTSTSAPGGSPRRRSRGRSPRLVGRKRGGGPRGPPRLGEGRRRAPDDRRPDPQRPRAGLRGRERPRPDASGR